MSVSGFQADTKVSQRGMWVGYPSVCWVMRLDTSEVWGIFGGYFGEGTPDYAAGAPHTPSLSYLISTYSPRDLEVKKERDTHTPSGFYDRL